MSNNEALLALSAALKREGILFDHHLMIWTPLPIPTRGSVVPGWFLQLADKRDGTLTRFYFSGLPVEDFDHKVVLLKGLFGIPDTQSDHAVHILTAAVNAGAVRAEDGEVETHGAKP